MYIDITTLNLQIGCPSDLTGCQEEFRAAGLVEHGVVDVLEAADKETAADTVVVVDSGRNAAATDPDQQVAVQESVETSEESIETLEESVETSDSSVRPVDPEDPEAAALPGREKAAVVEVVQSVSPSMIHQREVEHPLQ